MNSKEGLVCTKGERVLVSYYNTDHELVFILTSKQPRDYYFLYELVNGKLKRLGRAKSPTELEEKFEVNQRLECRLE